VENREVIGSRLAQIAAFAARRLCVCVLVCGSLLYGAGAQAAPVPVLDVPVMVQILSAPGLILKVGDLQREPMRFRVLRSSDAMPLANVNLDVFVNYRGCIPLDPNCQEDPPGLYGHFETAGSPSSLMLVTGADGSATAPLFRAGSVSGRYDIVAAVYRMDNEATGYVSSSGGATVAVNQTGSAVFEVPAMSAPMLALLGGLLLLGWLYSRRRESRH
jgi:hypothetical protein